MVVLILVHARAAKLISGALDACARVLTAQTPSKFAMLLDREPVDVAVVDPSVGAMDSTARTEVDPVVRALSAIGAPPFILCLSDARDPLTRRAALVRLGPAMVAVGGADDSPERLRSVVDQATASGVASRLLSLLAESLTPLGPRVREALMRALRSPLEFSSVPALARAAGLSRRGLSRKLRDTGLAPPRDWLATAVVLRAYWELRDPAVKIRHLVELMGYSRPECLAKNIRRLTGVTPSQLRGMSVAELSSVLAGRLVACVVAPAKVPAATRGRGSGSRTGRTVAARADANSLTDAA